jgi:hypothetical protein
MRPGLWTMTTLPAIAWALAAGCLPGSGPPLLSREDAAPPPGTNLDDDASVNRRDVDLGDPFAVDGLVPSHGPWTGATRAKISGRGFSSRLRVWIGGIELDPSAVFASDPTRAAIVTPAGNPGAVDVRIRDDDSKRERVLPGGFTYDAFAVLPDSGATSGGTRIGIAGRGTKWTSGTTVAIGGKPCDSIAIVDPETIQCVTPPGAPGAKDVTVTTPDNVSVQARDAFTYSDSPDGYRGGLSGGILAGSLRVLAFDAWTGVPLAGAKAIAGGDLATAIVQSTNAAGVAQIALPAGTTKVTVTLAAKCHQPMTFVDVPVDTATLYLQPTLDPECASGDPPSSGNRGVRNGGAINGELVWPQNFEFGRAKWNNVPSPTRPSERQAAYVFTAAGSPGEPFTLPPADAAVTPTSLGQRGYSFEIVTYPGNMTVYALAGIEDRSATPPRFTAYAMGVARSVSVQPGYRTTGVDIPMTSLVDHQVTLAPQPPPVGPRGPDRLQSQIAVTLGNAGFAIVSQSAKVSMLPLGGNVTFVGMPSLDATLAGESYVIGAVAATGQFLQYPASVVSRVKTTQANAPVSIGGFLPVPTMQQPAGGTWDGTHVEFAASGAYDLAELVVTSGGGFVTWTIIAPAGATSFDLPDLSTLPDNVGLVRGAIGSTLYVARLDQFSYAKLRSGQLGTGAWNAYALDNLWGAY